jgi:hypothetical protein
MLGYLLWIPVVNTKGQLAGPQEKAAPIAQVRFALTLTSAGFCSQGGAETRMRSHKGSLRSIISFQSLVGDM